MTLNNLVIGVSGLVIGFVGYKLFHQKKLDLSFLEELYGLQLTQKVEIKEDMYEEVLDKLAKELVEEVEKLAFEEVKQETKDMNYESPPPPPSSPSPSLSSTSGKGMLELKISR